MSNPNENITDENDIDLVPVDDTQNPTENDTTTENNENSDTSPTNPRLRDSLKNLGQKTKLATILAADSLGDKIESKMTTFSEKRKANRQLDETQRQNLIDQTSAHRLEKIQTNQQIKAQIHQSKLENKNLIAQAKIEKEKLKSQTKANKILESKLEADARQAEKLAKSQKMHAQAQALLNGAAIGAGGVAAANIVSNEVAHEANQVAAEANENAQNSQAVAQEAVADANQATQQAQEAREQTQAVEDNIPEVAAAAAAGAVANETRKGLGNRLGDWRKNSRRNAIEARVQNPKTPKKPIFENVKFIKPDLRGYFSNLKNNAKIDWQNIKNIFVSKNKKANSKNNLSLKQEFLNDFNSLKNIFGKIGNGMKGSVNYTKTSAKADADAFFSGINRAGEKISDTTKNTISQLEKDANSIGKTAMWGPNLVWKGMNDMAEDIVKVGRKISGGSKAA